MARISPGGARSPGGDPFALSPAPPPVPANPAGLRYDPRNVGRMPSLSAAIHAVGHSTAHREGDSGVGEGHGGEGDGVGEGDGGGGEGDGDGGEGGGGEGDGDGGEGGGGEGEGGGGDGDGGGGDGGGSIDGDGGGDEGCTRAIQRSLDPKWEQQFRFELALHRLLGASMQLELFDEATISSAELSADDSLGATEVDVQELKALVSSAGNGGRELTKQLEGGRGAVTVHVQVTQVTPPSICGLCVEALKTALVACRALFLYWYLPYDRTGYDTYLDWRHLLLAPLAASPDLGVRVWFFSIYLACLMVDRDEYQLTRFIVVLKGSQFLSALWCLLEVSLSFWPCAVLKTALSSGLADCDVRAWAGVGNTVPFGMAMTLWLQALLWTAFLLIPFASKYDVAKGVLGHQAGIQLWNYAADESAKGAYKDGYVRLEEDDGAHDGAHGGAHDGAMRGVALLEFECPRSLSELKALLLRAVLSARLVWRILSFPQHHVRYRPNRRLAWLLRWDAYALSLCAGLLVVMVAAGASADEVQKLTSVPRRGLQGMPQGMSPKGWEPRLEPLSVLKPLEPLEPLSVLERRLLRATVETTTGEPQLSGDRGGGASGVPRWRADPRLCLDDCTLTAGGYRLPIHNNGVCDDGGPGAFNHDCEVAEAMEVEATEEVRAVAAREAAREEAENVAGWKAAARMATRAAVATEVVERAPTTPVMTYPRC
jgi:hypothetical protein